MNPIVFAIPVFMLTIVIEAWLARRRGLRVYDIADAITSLHHGVLSQVSGLLVRLAALGIYAAVYERYRATSLSADSVWVWAGALLAYDFCYYWSHRMGHEVGVLWAAHVVHHSSEYYNLSTALRQTSSGFLLGWIFYFPMAVAGVPPLVLGGVGLIDLLYQYWVHTELIGRLGWLDRVLVTPSNHRVHHGQNDYCIDRNYGGILVLWDRLFGSFVEERVGEPIVYGVRKPLRSFNPLWGNLHYYADLWHAARDARCLDRTAGRLERRTDRAFRGPPFRALQRPHAARDEMVCGAAVRHPGAICLPFHRRGQPSRATSAVRLRRRHLRQHHAGRLGSRRRPVRAPLRAAAHARFRAWLRAAAGLVRLHRPAAAAACTAAGDVGQRGLAGAPAKSGARVNGDALSDLLLAAVALPLAWRLAGRRPAMALAMGLIGAAAVCGVLRFQGLAPALGPHRFLSLVAACAGLPLLAASLLWPDGALATRPSAAWRFAVLAGGVGVLIVAVAGQPLWSDAAAAVSALSIAYRAWQARKPLAIGASLALLAGFGASASGVGLAPFDAVQELHVLMALSLALMGWEEWRPRAGAAVHNTQK